MDQTAQLGGAELCLKDIVLCRRHVSDRVLLFQDGPFADVLRDNGVAVSTCALSSRGAEVRKSSGGLQKVASLVDVGRLARQVATAAKTVDVIYANTAKALVVSALAGRLAKKPVIYHLHDILSADHFSWSNRTLLVQLGKRCTNHVIANSVATANEFIAAGGRRERVSIVYNGIDTRPFTVDATTSRRDRLTIRSAIGVTDEPVIGLFGRFAEWKGQHLALAAIRRLPGAHLMLVGDALFSENDYVERLQRLASDPEICGRVHFMGFRQDVPALMRATDYVIHCSTAPEPFGRVIVESMLAERPVIASRAGGAMEIIQEGVTGLLFEPESVEQLVGRVNQLLSGEVNSKALVSAAVQDARQRFDLNARVGDINRIIDATAAR